MRPREIPSAFLDEEVVPRIRRTTGDEPLALLESESPFRDAFEGPGDEVGTEEAWDSQAFYDERAPDELLGEDETVGLDWESLDAETGAEITVAIAQFAVRLGGERAVHSDRPASAEEQHLLQDYRDTLAGAHARWGRRYGAGRFTAEAIGRAWMISREEETRFRYSSSTTLRTLTSFAPPAERVALIQHPLVGSSNKAPVAPIVGRFADDLHRRYPDMSAQNYTGHGGGAFNGRGYSLDLYITPKDARGFYRPDDAVRFLRAVHEAAAVVNAEWRVIYNDFSVADALNRATGRRNVIFVGTVRRDRSKRVTGLNWHGPDPLILHFHLDLAPRAGSPAPTGPLPATTPRPVSPPPTTRPAAELVRFAQRVLNRAEGERLAVDGDLGPRTRAALERFRRRYSLGAGGVLDARTELALAQRVLEELAQQSLFAPGTRDATTEQALRNFKAERGLAPNATLDAAARAALADALERRAGPGPASSRHEAAAGDEALQDVEPEAFRPDEDGEPETDAEAASADDDEEAPDLEASDEEGRDGLEVGELDPAVLAIAERVMARGAPELEEQVSRRWTRCFSAADIGRVRAVYQSNAAAADSCSCIVMLNVALGQLLSLPLKSSPARTGSARSVQMADLPTGSIEKAMATLVGSGHALGPVVMDFYDRRRRTAGTLKPVALKRSVQARVLARVRFSGCWFAFGLSIMDGYHSVLLLVDRTAVAAKIYWLDQYVADVTDDVTSTLDQRLTERTQAYWQGVMDEKGKGYKTTIRLWPLRKPRR